MSREEAQSVVMQISFTSSVALDKRREMLRQGSLDIYQVQIEVAASTGNMTVDRFTRLLVCRSSRFRTNTEDICASPA